MSKIYTAQELREESNKVTQYDCYVASDMLRQAADMRERLDELEKPKMDSKNETVAKVLDDLSYLITIGDIGKNIATDIKNRIEAAHSREVSELKKELDEWKSNCNFNHNDRKKKAAQIAELRECLQLAVEMKCTNCGLCTRGTEPCYPEGQIVHHEDCLMIVKWRKALGGTNNGKR